MSHKTRPRMLMPNLWDSPKLEGIGVDAALLWFFLISQADDEGRGPLVLSVLSVRPFLVVDGRARTLDETEESLARLVEKGLVYDYSDSGRRYYQLHDWTEHQKIRADRKMDSTYPTPVTSIESSLSPSDNQVTTKPQPDDNQVATNCQPQGQGQGQGQLQGVEDSSKSPIFGDTGKEGNPPSREEAGKVAKALREAALEATGGKGKLQPKYYDTDRIMVLLSRSNYTCEDLLAMIEFARGDPFWRAHVLSGGDLEKHAGKLFAKVQAKEAEPLKEQGRPQPPMVDLDEFAGGKSSSPEHVGKVVGDVLAKLKPQKKGG